MSPLSLLLFYRFSVTKSLELTRVVRQFIEVNCATSEVEKDF